MLQAQSGDFPHLMVYGPSGAGKKTRIICVLRELYGSGAEKLRIEHMTYTVCHMTHAPPMSHACTMIILIHAQTPSKKKIEISSIASNYHVEINPRYKAR